MNLICVVLQLKEADKVKLSAGLKWRHCSKSAFFFYYFINIVHLDAVACFCNIQFLMFYTLLGVVTDLDLS